MTDWELTPEIDLFVDAARHYCDIVEIAHEYMLPERLVRVSAAVARLYAAALYLPFEDKPDDHEEPPVAPEVGDWPGFEELTMFWQVPDAYAWGAPVVGSLNETLLGMYRSVKRGLLTFERGFSESDADMVTLAVWLWRDSRDTYWGALAADALRALHRAMQKVNEGQRDF